MQIRVITESTPVARKSHRCEECGRAITKGAIYLRQTNTDGSDIWTYKAHPDCRDLASDYRMIHSLWHDEWMPMWEMIEGDYPHYDSLTPWRGILPHAVCRLELTDQLRGR